MNIKVKKYSKTEQVPVRRVSLRQCMVELADAYYEEHINDFVDYAANITDPEYGVADTTYIAIRLWMMRGLLKKYPLLRDKAEMWAEVIANMIPNNDNSFNELVYSRQAELDMYAYDDEQEAKAMAQEDR